MVRREIQHMDYENLVQLIENAKQSADHELMTDYLFNEIANCPTDACRAVLLDMTQRKSFNNIKK